MPHRLDDSGCLLVAHSPADHLPHTVCKLPKLPTPHTFPTCLGGALAPLQALQFITVPSLDELRWPTSTLRTVHPCIY